MAKPVYDLESRSKAADSTQIDQTRHSIKQSNRLFRETDMDDLTAILETALIHQQAGRLDQAEDIYRKILGIDPTHAGAVHLLGTLMQRRGDYHEAVALISKAILLEPGVADFHANLAAVYLALGQPVEAAAHGRTALKLDPEFAAAAYNLATALFSLGEVAPAVEMFENALEMEPANQTFWANYLFALNFSPDADPAAIYDANCRWGETVTVASGSDKIDFSNSRTSDRKLKLAYFLPELDQHVTVRFLEPVLSAHDREKFTVYVYGDRTDGAPPPPGIGDKADFWINVHQWSAAQIAEQMRNDAIDILAHPCTFKARYRPVLAHRAAPVQIACTNLVSTTGLTHTDYLITDNFICPPEEGDEYFTEKLIRLKGFNIYQSLADLPEPGPLPASENGTITFGSFNNIAKLTDRVATAWAEILRSVDGSRLFLKNGAFDDAAVRAQVTERFADLEILENQIMFEGFTRDPATYLKSYQQVDIALDPFPFGGGTTSYEAIWMGAPVLTMAGDTFMGRLSGSLMHRLGLDEFVTASAEDYIATALNLAGDLKRLSQIRSGLRQTARSTIFNAESHVAELEQAYIAAWETHCRQ